MVRRLALLWFVAATTAAYGSGLPANAPYEIVRDHVEISVEEDGSYTADREEIYRVFDETGVKLLQRRRFSFAQDYESLEVRAAYMRKPDGRRIDVPASDIVTGYGNLSGREYFDRQSVRLTYAGLEPQDQIVLVTRYRQLKPWFPGQFSIRALFSRTIVAHDVAYRLHAPEKMALHIDAAGVSGGSVSSTETGRHWVWQFANDTPINQAIDAVGEADFAPHLQISTFTGYPEVAKAFREHAKGRSTVTKNIAALANVLTRGVSDKKEQTRILYDWVSTNIAYVAIELGIGGFSPHAAEDVLQNRIGDCKDRAVLLEALLAAKGIESSPALINVGSGTYKLAPVASPQAFDHVITYLPSFDLFVDASDALAPFGVLPYPDAGKPVLLASNGKVLHTPVASFAHSQVQVHTTLAVRQDGSADGHSEVTAYGAYGVSLRAALQNSAANLLRTILGPTAEGKITRADPLQLQDPYVVAADYRLPNVIALPGPGALPTGLSFRPFSFTDLIAGRLPIERTSDYVCPSLRAEETVSLTLPGNVEAMSVPAGGELKTSEIRLKFDIFHPSAQAIMQKTTLEIDHPQATCTPAYYQTVRDDLRKMDGFLRRQIVYREQTPSPP